MSMVGVDQSLELHDKVEFHGVLGGIIAPIVSHLLKQLVFELLKFFLFHLAFHQSTGIDVGLGVIAGALILSHGVVELLDGVLSCSFVEEADAHIAGTKHLVVFILGSGACAVGKEVFPTFELDAYTTILVDII